MKLDILAVGSHPDDVELSCAGTIAKEIDRGKKVGILDLTRGELGTRGTAQTREAEAKAAAEILGVRVRENLEFSDGFFENNTAHKLEVIKVLRKYRPEIVLCNAIEDRHIDHAKGAQLVHDACFLSGLRRIETICNGKNQKAWRPKQVLHYIQWKNLEPDVVVDISGYIDKKLESVMAYKTQFYDKNSAEPETPISSSNFLDSITYRARDLGRLINTEHAEGFTSARHIAVDSVFDLL
ncbi:bacillithiol biosynthesis deacetylase BshB1 [Salegentibacter sp. HM20]